MTIHRILYRSMCAIDGSPDHVEAEVSKMVEAARAANERSGITGALLSSFGVFVQAIEGPIEAVEQTFERICGDMRHRHLQVIDFTSADGRSFPEWSMASVSPKGEFVRLCATLHSVRDAHVDPMSAGATIQLMRTMVMVDQPSRPNQAASSRTN